MRFTVYCCNTLPCIALKFFALICFTLLDTLSYSVMPLIKLCCTVLHHIVLRVCTVELFAEWESSSSNSLEPTERLLSGSYQDWWPCSVLSVICCQTLRLRDPPHCVLLNAVIQLLLKSPVWVDSISDNFSKSKQQFFFPLNLQSCAYF